MLILLLGFGSSGGGSGPTNFDQFLVGTVRISSTVTDSIGPSGTSTPLTTIVSTPPRS